MLRLVGVTINEDIDIYNGMRMIKGFETKHSRSKIERILTQARLYSFKPDALGRKEKVYPRVGDLSWKEKNRLIELVDTPRAFIRNVRISPRKLRLLADAIRGKGVDDAIGILQFAPKGGAPILLKLLKSAIANAGNNHELKADDLFVAQVLVDGGPVLRRFMARARGRACRIRKPTSHAKIVLRERPDVVRTQLKAAKAASEQQGKGKAASAAVEAKAKTPQPAPAAETKPQGGK